MAIYTKKGDEGQSYLSSKNSIPKDDPRFLLLGDLDELNSYLGLVKSQIDNQENVIFIELIQRNIMLISAHIYDRENKAFALTQSDVHTLEQKIDETSQFVSNDGFVLPGENTVSATLDICRTVARRAERWLVTVDREYQADVYIKQYINRLSDCLYAMARYNDSIDKITKSIVHELIARDEEKIFDGILNLEKSKILIEKIEAKSKQMGLSAAIAVCDKHGNPIAVHNMDGAYLISFQVAMKKAYSAVALKMPTSQLNQLIQSGEMFFGLCEGIDSLLAIGGGVPLVRENQLFGGLGVSGSTAEQDEQLANYGAEIFLTQ